MLTELKKSYERLIKSKEFDNKGFLCGAFLICDIADLDKTNWQIDFYNKDSDTMTSYKVGNNIEVVKDEKVFKEENTNIEELNLKDIKVNFNDTKDKLKNILGGKNEEPVKITIILQQQKIPVWNIIYITKKFNLLNIRISAIDGKVLEEKIVPLLSFERGEGQKWNK